MGETQVVSALRDKRSELAGRIEEAERDIARSRADLEHIDGALRIFAPGLTLESIGAKRPRQGTGPFRPGELSRLLMNILRRAGAPASTRDLYDAVMTAKGFALDDDESYAVIAKAVSASLGKLKRRGAVMAGLGDDHVNRWSIAPPRSVTAS